MKGMTLEYVGKDYLGALDPRELFLYFVRERYSIFIARQRGFEKPWSEDPIFRSIYFCNVFREDDKTTKYIRNWALDLYSDKNPHPPNRFITLYTFARLINWPDTLNEIYPKTVLFYPYPSEVIKILKGRRAKGLQVFNGAYQITTCGKVVDKIDYIMRVVTDTCGMDVKQTLQEQWKEITKIKGLGSFLAAQVVADLKNTKELPWSTAVDWYDFVASGPGSLRGVNYYLGKKPKPPASQETFNEVINEAQKDIQEMLKTNICKQDVQNCFCEFSKYMKVLHGGMAKRNYDGGE